MIGHFLRQDQDNHNNVVLTWAPEGKRKTGKDGGSLWRPYVPRGAKKLGNR